LKESASNSLAMVTARARQAREKDDGNRVRHVAAKATRRLHDSNGAPSRWAGAVGGPFALRLTLRDRYPRRRG